MRVATACVKDTRVADAEIRILALDQTKQIGTGQVYNQCHNNDTDAMQICILFFLVFLKRI